MTKTEVFVDFMVRSGVLLFGDFTLKSGRKSPYFINTGEYKLGSQIEKLGGFYADLIIGANQSFDALYGPAYKGIPLVTAAALKLAERGIDYPVSYNRKEPKGHGEDRMIQGYLPKNGDRIAIVEDVTSAGTSVRETKALLQSLGIDAAITTLFISIDRMERGTGSKSAIRELSEDMGVRVFSIATVNDVIAYLKNPASHSAVTKNAEEYAEKMQAYLNEYGGE